MSKSVKYHRPGVTGDWARPSPDTPSRTLSYQFSKMEKQWQVKYCTAGNCSTEYNKAWDTLYFTACYIGYTPFTPVARSQRPTNGIFIQKTRCFSCITFAQQHQQLPRMSFNRLWLEISIFFYPSNALRGRPIHIFQHARSSLSKLLLLTWEECDSVEARVCQEKKVNHRQVI